MGSVEVLEITPSAVYVKLPSGGGDNKGVVIIELWDGRCYEVVLDIEDARELADNITRVVATGKEKTEV